MTQITASTVSLTVDDVTASQAFLTTHLPDQVVEGFGVGFVVEVG